MKNGLISLKKRKYDNQNCYLNYLDLLMPFNGMITTHQCIIISRILDIERFFEGKEFYWQRRLTLLGGLEKLDNDDLERLDRSFYDLLISLKEKGYDSSINKIIVSKHPVELLNGTHRLAWISLFEKSLQILCVSVNDYSPFPTDGFQWMNCINLPVKEVDVIKERYNRLLTENNYRLLVIVSNNTCYMLLDEISKFFIVYGDKKNIFISKDKKRKLEKNGVKISTKSAEDVFSFFYLKLSSQLLMMENGEVKSTVICALERRLNIIDDLKDKYWIAHTVSESIKIMDIVQD